jgi:hypothetical protein
MVQYLFSSSKQGNTQNGFVVVVFNYHLALLNPSEHAAIILGGAY